MQLRMCFLDSMGFSWLSRSVLHTGTCRTRGALCIRGLHAAHPQLGSIWSQGGRL